MLPTYKIKITLALGAVSGIKVLQKMQVIYGSSSIYGKPRESSKY